MMIIEGTVRIKAVDVNVVGPMGYKFQTATLLDIDEINLLQTRIGKKMPRLQKSYDMAPVVLKTIIRYLVKEQGVEISDLKTGWFELHGSKFRVNWR